MVELASVCVSTVLYGMGLWGSVKILDRYNTRNSMVLALVVGLLFALIMPWMGLLFAVLPLMGLLFLLVFYYQLGYLHALLVIVLQGVILYIAAELLRGVIGDLSEETAVAWMIVVGFLLFLAFYVRRDLARRKSGVRDRLDSEPIPPARLRTKKKRGSDEPRPTPDRPTQEPAQQPERPPPSPPQAPNAPRAEASQPAEARPLPAAGSDPDEPRFLR